MTGCAPQELVEFVRESETERGAIVLIIGTGEYGDVQNEMLHHTTCNRRRIRQASYLHLRRFVSVFEREEERS